MLLLYRSAFCLPFASRALSLLPASAYQRGLGVDRQSDRCIVVCLARVAYVEHIAAAPLLRYCQ